MHKLMNKAIKYHINLYFKQQHLFIILNNQKPLIILKQG